jgi:hypothetical protein
MQRGVAASISFGAVGVWLDAVDIVRMPSAAVLGLLWNNVLLLAADSCQMLPR